MVKKLAFFFVFCFFIFCCVAQRDGMEYIIKDTSILGEYKNNILKFQQQNNIEELARSYKRVADYYYTKNQDDSIIFFYTKAYKEYDKIKDSFYISFCFQRIGSLVAFRGLNLEDALHWLLPAASWYERNNEYVLAAHINFDISNAYKSAGNWDKRIFYKEKATAINKLAKDTLLSVILNLATGEDLWQQGAFEESFIENKKALLPSKFLREPLFRKLCQLNLAEYYLYKKDLPHAKIALEDAAQIDIPTHSSSKKFLYYLSASYHILKNNSTRAIKYLNEYRREIESIAKRKEKDRYAELIVKFESEKNQVFISSLQRENKLKDKLAERQRILIIGLTAGLCLLMLLGWIVYKNFNNRRKLQVQLLKQEEHFSAQLLAGQQERMNADFNKQLAEVQLTALSAQMNPHFIFNCMNSIQKYVLKNEKGKALDFLQNFSDLMRIVLDNSVKPKVQLDEEIKMLDKYILLERQRLDNRFSYYIDIDKTLQTDFFEIPGMLIQPYVENAIWHGLMNLSETDKQGLLIVAFSKEENFIQCVITDNGVGRAKAAELTKSKSPGHKSYGMAISQKRLQLLKMDNEKLPKEQIEDLYKNGEPCGTRVTLNIYIT
jgi:hypothetical protein